MNHLNIFSTPKAGREIVLIDYDYCSYNYPTFDIANFLNESSINYLHPVEPFYELV
jgi:choline/ethanolamine kinase